MRRAFSLQEAQGTAAVILVGQRCVTERLGAQTVSAGEGTTLSP
jgi:hypothetical protein